MSGDATWGNTAVNAVKRRAAVRARFSMRARLLLSPPRRQRWRIHHPADHLAGAVLLAAILVMGQLPGPDRQQAVTVSGTALCQRQLQRLFRTAWATEDPRLA